MTVQNKIAYKSLVMLLSPNIGFNQLIFFQFQLGRVLLHFQTD